MKKTILLISLGILITSTVTYAATTFFSDVPEDTWYTAAVKDLTEKGIIEGYEDGTYRPEQDVSRAELAVMLNRLDQHVTTGEVISPAVMQLAPKTGDTIATLQTSHGDIKMLLYTEEIPKLTTNFIELAKDNMYDDTIFHRVVEDFIIQGGDFENGDGTGGYTYLGEGTTLPDEFAEELSHIKGAVGMANRGPDTNGSQFYIVQAEDGTAFLDGMYSIFGYVYEGMDVVDEIAALQDGTFEKPSEEVALESVEISTY